MQYNYKQLNTLKCIIDCTLHTLYQGQTRSNAAAYRSIDRVRRGYTLKVSFF